MLMSAVAENDPLQPGRSDTLKCLSEGRLKSRGERAFLASYKSNQPNLKSLAASPVISLATHRVFKNAMSAFLSLSERPKPNACPCTGRVVNPYPTKPVGR